MNNSSDSASREKPWLTVDEQVDCLRDKGVKFDICSVEEAKAYLEKNNNYFRLGSYRKTFPKYEGGENSGKFISLDFAMLVDLSVVDMLLRRQMLPMTLDIEHFEKMRLLKRVEDEGEDGYEIVGDFLSSYDRVLSEGVITNRVKDDIKRGASSPYVSDLIAKHPHYDYPIWAFMEVIAFGTFIELYNFCAKRFDDRKMLDNYYMLQKVKSMRNACAHNNCILNNLASGTSKHRTPNDLYRAVAATGTVGKGARKARLSNDRLQEMAATLHRHKLVASEGVNQHRANELRGFKDRMQKHESYYCENLQISSSFDFLAKLIDAWYGNSADE